MVDRIKNHIIQYLIYISFSDLEDQRSSWVVGPGDMRELTQPTVKDGVPLPPSKPRIWSMAELAVSKSSYIGCG